MFRIELNLGDSSKLKDEEGYSPHTKSLEFSLSDEIILAGFSTLIDRVADSLSDFLRPENSKVTEVSGSKLAAEWEQYVESLRTAEPV